MLLSVLRQPQIASKSGLKSKVVVGEEFIYLAIERLRSPPPLPSGAQREIVLRDEFNYLAVQRLSPPPPTPHHSSP